MSMFTVRKPSAFNGIALEEGWNVLEIKDAKESNYNGTRFVDVWFEGLPEKMNLRMYEAKNRDTGEEFAINTMFLYANAPLKYNGMTDSDGNYVVELSNNPKDLIGKKLSVYLYKEGEYHRIYRRVAPGEEFANDVAIYRDTDIAGIKRYADKAFASQNGKPTASAAPKAQNSLW